MNKEKLKAIQEAEKALDALKEQHEKITRRLADTSSPVRLGIREDNSWGERGLNSKYLILPPAKIVALYLEELQKEIDIKEKEFEAL